MTESSHVLVHYYAAVDAGDYPRALSYVADDIRYGFLLPGGGSHGQGLDGIRAYLDGRGDVVRRHIPLRTSSDRDMEFVYGSVLENERERTGFFMASAVVRDGQMVGYQVVFDPELGLVQEAPS